MDLQVYFWYREIFIIQAGEIIMLISYSYKKLFKFETGLHMAGQMSHVTSQWQIYSVFFKKSIFS